MQDQESYSFPPSDDPRLSRIIDSWHTFENSITGAGKVGVVYHGDMDGLVGAAYIKRTLLKYVPEGMLKTYWVSTDEYDFELLRQWVKEQDLQICVFTDVSIENHLPTLEFISQHVSKKVFIYDHHFVNNTFNNHKITLANPTPKKLEKGETPIPTFLFAYRVARENNLQFPALNIR
jgi:single-stranded DNA-specific DHH superfamily exonuclease